MNFTLSLCKANHCKLALTYSRYIYVCTVERLLWFIFMSLILIVIVIMGLAMSSIMCYTFICYMNVMSLSCATNTMSYVTCLFVTSHEGHIICYMSRMPNLHFYFVIVRYLPWMPCHKHLVCYKIFLSYTWVFYVIMTPST